MNGGKMGRMMDRTALGELAETYANFFEHYGDHRRAIK